MQLSSLHCNALLQLFTARLSLVWSHLFTKVYDASSQQVIFKVPLRMLLEIIFYVYYYNYYYYKDTTVDYLKTVCATSLQFVLSPLLRNSLFFI